MISRVGRISLFRSVTITRLYTESASDKGGSNITAPPASSIANVPGLSEACIKPTSQPVGPDVDPNKSGAYKVPEYFCYNNMSYFEAEIEMSKYRCEQPSATK